MDIARPSNVKKKRIRQAIYAGVGLLAVGARQRRTLTAQAGGADRRTRGRVARHRQARTDGAPGPRTRDPDAGRHPVDSRDNTGARGEDHPEARHAGEERQRDSRAQQPDARTAAAGRRVEARRRRSRPCQSESPAPERPPGDARVGGQHRRRLQQGAHDLRDEAGAGERQTRLGPRAETGPGGRRAAERSKPDREGTARDEGGFHARADGGPAVRWSIKRARSWPSPASRRTS